MGLSGRVFVLHEHSLGFMPQHHQNKKTKQNKKETLFHQQDKQLQGKLTGCQGKGTKAQTHQLDSSSLFDTQEKHLKALD